MIAVPRPRAAASRSPARSSARTTSTPRSSAASALDDAAGARGPGGDRRRLRRQGGVPLDHRGSTPRCSRARPGKPVRMIYDRHEDIAATTKRHPAIVRHRTGVTRDGTAHRPGHRGRHGRRRVLHADAGRAVSRGALHAGGPYRCPNVRIRGRATAPTRRPTAPSAGSARRRPSSRPRCTSTGSPSALGHLAARHPATQRLPAGRHDADRPGPARERGRRGGPRARRRGRRSSSGCGRGPKPRGGRARARGRSRARPLRTERERTASGIGTRPGLARRRLHRLRRGQARLASPRSS